MAHQTTPGGEYNPWAERQREESHQMSVTNEVTQKADGKEAPVRILVWILVAV